MISTPFIAYIASNPCYQTFHNFVLHTNTCVKPCGITNLDSTQHVVLDRVHICKNMELNKSAEEGSASDAESTPRCSSRDVSPSLRRAHTVVNVGNHNRDFMDHHDTDRTAITKNSSLVASLIASQNPQPTVRRTTSLPSQLLQMRMDDSNNFMNFKGVSRELWQTRFDARYVDSIKGIEYNLGAFDTAAAAARAVDLLALKHGNFSESYLNFPLRQYEEDISVLETCTVAELVETLNEVSRTVERRTSRFRGVVPVEEGFESRIEVRRE
jgi:hypothetical protein